MDSISQIVLGGAVAAAIAPRGQRRAALLAGAALGTLPDLDSLVLLALTDDPVTLMTAHRGLSHSLFVLPLLGSLLWWLFKRFGHGRVAQAPGRWWWAIVLALVTHPLLDAMTVYGTQLWWPLPVTPAVWGGVFIIDPLYTLPLLVAVGAGLARGLKDRPARLPTWALALSCLYIACSVAGRQMAEQRVEQALAAAQIRPQALFVAPAPFNVLLWRVIALDGEDYHEALVSWFDRAPPRLSRIPRGTQLAAALRDSPQHQRLQWFTQGFLRYDRIDDQLIVTDLRLGMTGFHPFRFAMASWQDGRWQLAERVERLPARRGDLAQLQQLFARIWNEEQPVPLEQWAQALQRP